MLLTGLYSLFLFLAVPISPVAQQPQPPAPADPQEVRGLLRLIGFDQQIDALWNSMAPLQAENMKTAVATQLKNAGKNVDAKRIEQAVATFTESFHKLFAESLESEIVEIYRRYFTRDEIRGLVEFWGSPLGRKLSSTSPALIQEGANAGRRLGQQTVGKLLQDPEFMQKMNAILDGNPK